jgi:hypothetical protein
MRVERDSFFGGISNAQRSKAKKTSSVCILARWPITYGQTKLSTWPTTPAPQPNKMNPLHQCPLATKIITAGAHTAAEPIIGINENSALTTPQRTGEGKPSTKKAMLTRVPWATPTARQP